jgi:hypothetical protein
MNALKLCETVECSRMAKSATITGLCPLEDNPSTSRVYV